MQLLAELLLKKNQIPFDASELEFQIESHPSDPSLYTITEVFDHFKITNIAARVPQTQDALNELPDYFIAQVSSPELSELCFVERQTDQYKLKSINGHSKTISQSDFLSAFTGIVLVVEKPEDHTQGTISKNLLSKIGLVISSICILYVFFISTADTLSSLIFLTAVAGIIVSISILQQEFGIKNPLGEAFCSSGSDKKNCNAVLNSSGAEVFGNYKLSDLSFIYFVGLTISIFLLSIQELSLTPICILGLFGLPVTIYSIYYQAFKLKTWCILCLSTVGILWVQASISLWSQSLSLPINLELSGIFSLAIGFLSSFSIWAYSKPKYLEAQANWKYKIGYYKFKKNYTIFSLLLKEKPQIETEIKDLEQIVFGNPESNLKLLIVTNPFCGHCKPMHSIIEKILDKYNDDVEVVVRFNINVTDPTSDIFSIAANLTEIYLTKGQKTSLLAMQEAYHELNPTEWINKWATSNIDNSYYLENLTLQKAWCIENKINFTPEILINGHSFPKEYERSDVLFFIEELHEEYNTATPIEETLY